MAEEENQVLLLCSRSSRYFGKLLKEKLEKLQINIDMFDVSYGVSEGEEVLMKLDFKGKDPSFFFGKDCIYVSSLTSDPEFMELFKIASALSAYGTRSRIFVIPFLGYSTMERAVIPGEVVTCKVNIRLLSMLPSFGFGNAFLLLDLHVNGILHYFEGSMLRTELSALNKFIEMLKRSGESYDKFMFASADLGRPKWIEALAAHFKTDIAFIRKSRSFTETKVQEVIGNVKGKHVIIYDDMTRSGGTLIKAAEVYMKSGALSVSALLSHLALNDESVIHKLQNSCIKQIIGTNSHPFTENPTLKQYISDENPSFLLPTSSLHVPVALSPKTEGILYTESHVYSSNPLTSTNTTCPEVLTPITSCDVPLLPLVKTPITKKFFILDISDEFAYAIRAILKPNLRRSPSNSLAVMRSNDSCFYFPRLTPVIFDKYNSPSPSATPNRLSPLNEKGQNLFGSNSNEERRNDKKKNGYHHHSGFFNHINNQVQLLESHE